MILSYVAQEITQANSFNALVDIGTLGYEITRLVFILRSFDISIRTQSKPYFTLDDVNTTISKIRSIQDSLIADYNSFKFCGTSSIISQKIMPYWILESNATQKFCNLYEFADMISQNVIQT